MLRSQRLWYYGPEATTLGETTMPEQSYTFNEPERTQAMQVKCPTCEAKRLERCVYTEVAGRIGENMDGVHWSRIRARQAEE